MRATRSQAEFSELSAERMSETLTLKLEISQFLLLLLFSFLEKNWKIPISLIFARLQLFWRDKVTISLIY